MKRISALLITFFILSLFLPIWASGQPNNIDNINENEEVDIIAEPIESAEIQGKPEPSEVLENFPDIDAEAAILIDQNTAKVLYEKNADKLLYPASTTKILTALLALEYGNIKDLVIVGNEANLCHPDGSKAGLDLNEQITVENLLRGLLLPSGNDAAYTIAVYIGRKVSNDSSLPIEQALNKFTELMNKKATELGAEDSHFVNPHGYHDDEHYTTAHDLAIITREAMKYDFFREVVSTQMFTIEDWNGKDPKDPNKKEIRYWRNSNALIQENDEFYYEYATGGKTGYTSKAGHCLVTTATKDGMNLISVVLNDTKEGKWIDSIALMDYGFNNYQVHEPVYKGQRIQTVEVHNHSDDDSGWVDIITDGEYSDVISKKDVDKIEQEIVWNPELVYVISDTDENQRENIGGQSAIYLEAPIIKGQKVGTLIFKLDGIELCHIPLIAARSIDRKEKIIERFLPSSSDSDKQSIPLWLWIVGSFIVIIIILRIIALRRRKRKRRYIYTRRRY